MRVVTTPTFPFHPLMARSTVVKTSTSRASSSMRVVMSRTRSPIAANATRAWSTTATPASVRSTLSSTTVTAFATPAAGTYTITVDGVGYGTASTAYSDYAKLCAAIKVII